MNTATLEASEASYSAGKEGSPKSSSRLTINIPTDMLEELRDLADKEGVTVTELVRRSISAEKFLRTQHQLGNQLLVLEKGQTKPSRLVVFR